MKKVPSELKQHRQWVNWKTIERSGKKTKIPIQPNGNPAKSTDPSTWVAFDELADGQIGFVFSQADPYIGIDLDGCMNPETQRLDKWAREIVLKFGTYAEVSPSGTGVKMFGISDSIWKHKNKIDIDGEGYNGKKPGIEVYDCGRYFAVTGKRLKGASLLCNVDDALGWIVEKYGMENTAFGVDGVDVPAETPVMERAAKYIAKMEAAISGQSGHNACFKVACALVQGFAMTTGEAFALMATDYNPRCEPPWSERELRHKVESAAKQPGQRGYLRDANPKEWSKIFVRTGDAPRIEDEPEPPKQSGPRRTLLRDAAMDCFENAISGGDALIDTGIPELDYAIGGGLAMGEMVIVAARPSHGKSCVALQMIHHATRNGLGAVVVSEEMSALALGKRTIQFASSVPTEHWKTSSTDVLSDLNHHFEQRKEAVILESCGSAERVCAEVEKIVGETGAKVVAVDYVQLLSAKGSSRYEQVTSASQQLRRLTNKLGIITIVLAQLNRCIEGRKSFVPVMSDLKETGQLEQDADVILFGVWPHRIDATKPAKEYQFYIGKNRNRAINRTGFNVMFEPSRQMMLEQPVEELPNYNNEFTEYA